MRTFLFFLHLFIAFALYSQQPAFQICHWKGAVHIDSLKKCHQLNTAEPGIIIMKFDVVFNSVQGMAMYSMGGKDFDPALMDHILKGKPRELHLTITTLENGTSIEGSNAIKGGTEKIYKDVPLQIKY